MFSRTGIACPRAFPRKSRLKRIRKRLTIRAPRPACVIVSTLIETALVLILTLGGGIDALSAFWATWLSNPLVHGAALILSTLMLMSLVELPISFYRAFVIEEKFGFNKMTPRMFVLDLAKRGLLGILLGIPLLLGILWLMEKMGSNWWFYAWLVMDGLQPHCSGHFSCVDRSTVQ